MKDDKPLKEKVIELIPQLTKKVNEEKDPLKRHRLRIIKQELSKLADQL